MPGDDRSIDLSIFAAVRQQLGLDLALSKDAVDILIVDHVERPSEN